jgi:hypothetical protein
VRQGTRKPGSVHEVFVADAITRDKGGLFGGVITSQMVIFFLPAGFPRRTASTYSGCPFWPLLSRGVAGTVRERQKTTTDNRCPDNDRITMASDTAKKNVLIASALGSSLAP